MAKRETKGQGELSRNGLGSVGGKVFLLLPTQDTDFSLSQGISPSYESRRKNITHSYQAARGGEGPGVEFGGRTGSLRALTTALELAVGSVAGLEQSFVSPGTEQTWNPRRILLSLMRLW